MAILSSLTLIRTLSLAHLIAAYYFLVAPRVVADNNIIFMLGESMQMQHPTSLDESSDASAFIAVLLAFISVTDLAATLPTATINPGDGEHATREYWLANVPIRLTFLFALTGYVYLFKEGGMLGVPEGLVESIVGPGDNLQNSLVFSFGFLEIAAWFWIFTNLRDERREAVAKRVQQMKSDEDSL